MRKLSSRLESGWLNNAQVINLLPIYQINIRQILHKASLYFIVFNNGGQ